MNGVPKNMAIWTIYFVFLTGLILGVPWVLSRFSGISYPLAAVTSESMAPTLKPGDLVFLKGIEGRGSIEAGDIIVYKAGKDFVIHRVVKISRDVVFTKGDANEEIDWPVNFQKIVGKALDFNGKPVKIPYLGNISIALNTEQKP